MRSPFTFTCTMVGANSGTGNVRRPLGCPLGPRSVTIQNSFAESPCARKMIAANPAEPDRSVVRDGAGQDHILKCGQSNIREFGRPEQPRLVVRPIVCAESKP